jgi:methionyl aminopeptidase
MTITYKTPEEIEEMAVAGRLASEVLDYLTPYVVPGVSTQELDQLAHRYMVDMQRTIPAPLNYAPDGHKPYPKSICTSVNYQVCHGIPGTRELKKGDIINIDITVIKNGWHGDTSRMFLVGGNTGASIQAQRLCQITYEAMWQGIARVAPGVRLGSIGFEIQRFVEAAGFSVVREFCGHGIGRGFHENPQVLHYGQKDTGVELRPGMVFTIEPMVNAGKKDIKALKDGWTIVTKDHSLSAQWEHTIAVTASGYRVLTVSEGSPQPPSWVSR